jgi:uncharacterized protein (DUF2147 family)
MLCQTPLKTLAFIVGLLLSVFFLTTRQCQAGEVTHESILGLWVTQGHGSRVEIDFCTEGSSELCGRIVWLWEAYDEVGKPVRDLKNPNRDRRGEPLIGAKILEGFHIGSGEVLKGGSIYNPEDGGTYRATLRPLPHDRLEVRGCLMFFCQRQIWLRPEALE